MFFSEGEHVEIIRGLIRATQGDRLKWYINDSDIGEYGASTSKFTYYVRSRDFDDARPYIFQIWARREQDNKLISELDENSSTQSTQSIIGELYFAAKSSELGIKDLKKEIFSDLGLDFGE